MAFLTLASGIPDFSKGTIAFPFVISSDAVAAAAAAEPKPNVNEWPEHVLPLMVFGRKQSQVSYNRSVQNIMTWMSAVGPDGPPQDNVLIYTGGSTFENYVPPCIIGIDCSSPATPKLYVNLQTDVTPSVAGWEMECHSELGYLQADATGFDASLGSGWTGPAAIETLATALVDISHTSQTQPIFFELTVNDKTITPDVPHHFIISIDLTPGVVTHQPAGTGSMDAVNGTDAAIKISIAIDDVDYHGANNLGDGYVTGAGPNDVISDLAKEIASFGASPAVYVHNLLVPSVTYDSGALTIPSGSIDLGIPVTGYYAENNIKHKRGEIQVITGLYLDTSIQDNRRLFLKSDGTPETNFAALDALIAVTPGADLKIRFHGASRIKVGINDGSAGNFTTTGTVNIDLTTDFDITPP